MKSAKFWPLLAALVLVASPAQAQKKTDEEKRADAERRQQEDRAYRMSIQNIREQQVVNDPWSNMRGDDDKKKK